MTNKNLEYCSKRNSSANWLMIQRLGRARLRPSRQSLATLETNLQLGRSLARLAVGCCKFDIAWHLCSRQIYCRRLPGLGGSPHATLLRRSGGMRRMSRAYHASREEGRSLSDGEERPNASMYLQQFAPFRSNAKSAASQLYNTPGSGSIFRRQTD